ASPRAVRTSAAGSAHAPSASARRRRPRATDHARPAPARGAAYQAESVTPTKGAVPVPDAETWAAPIPTSRFGTHVAAGSRRSKLAIAPTSCDWTSTVPVEVVT